MAINPVQTRTSASQGLWDMLKQGAQQGATAVNEADQQTAAMNRQKDAQQSALAQMTQGKQQDYDLGQQGKSADQERNMAGIQALTDKGLANDGGSVKVGDVSVGSDPYAHVIGKQNQGMAGAIKNAQDAYMRGLPDIQKKSQAAAEGLDFVNDPQNPGSVGQARTLALKSMGMNRYNTDEAAAVLPPALHGLVADLFNKGGADNNPLNASQKQMMNSFFQHQLGSASDAHDTLKANALQKYTLSPYADAGKGAELEKSLGAPMAKTFSTYKTKYSQLPTSAQSQQTQQNPAAPLAPQPTPGIMDMAAAGLKRMFGGGSQQAAPPAAPQTKTVGGTTYVKTPKGWEAQ